MGQNVKETQLEMMLTVRQVSEYLQVSMCTLRRWSDRGMLRFYRIGSRGDRRYRMEDILRFVDESTRQPRADTEDKEIAVHPS